MSAEDRLVVVGVSPVDFRTPMIRWAAGEASAYDAALRLVTAVPPRAAPEQYLPAEAADSLRDAGLAHLTEAVELARSANPGLLVTTKVGGGTPVDVLRDAGKDADLLVVGADDQSTFAEAITGSVPGSLLTTAPCPLAVFPNVPVEVPDDAPVIVAMDDAGTSQAALAYGFEAAHRGKRPLVLLHCRPSGDKQPPSAGHTLTLSGFRGLYPNLDVRDEEITGDPTDVLADHSRHAALLVLGNRGHGRLTSTLFGSVSRSLIRRSGCPVVVARARSSPSEGALR